MCGMREGGNGTGEVALSPPSGEADLMPKGY